jgi:hypothetical protein
MGQVMTIGLDIANRFSRFTGSTLKGGGVLRRQLRPLAEGEPSTHDSKRTQRAAYAIVGSMSGRAALRKTE